MTANPTADWRFSLVAACGRHYEALLFILQSNNLGRRILKNTIATTISVVIAVIPAVIRVFGQATFLAPMTTVFAHPGQRLGMMVESQILILLGTTLGMCWSILGMWLSNFVFHITHPGAYSIRAVFLVFAIIFHGYLRSKSPRLFVFVLFHLIVATIHLTKGPVGITASLVTTIFYPILTANGIIILVNILIFPETASSFLGKSTIQSLFDTANALRAAGDWFIEEALGFDEDSEDVGGGGKRKGSNTSISEVQKARLANLTERKTKLRTTLAACKKAQAECNFELSYSFLPPRYLRPISTNGMTNLVQSTIALIGACESKYALVGDTQGNPAGGTGSLFTQNPFDVIPEENEREKPGETSERSKMPSNSTETRKPLPPKSKSPKPDIAEKLKLVKPQREVEAGDAEILELILKPIRKPIADLKVEIDNATDVVIAALAYSYGIRNVPLGWIVPDGLRPEEIDIRIDIFAEAIEIFDTTSAEALASAAALEDLESPDVDIMPRMETFLISSFLLSLRQAAIHTMQMLRHSRFLVTKRYARSSRRFYFPHKINWRKWLASGGEEDNSALPENARKSNRRGTRRESHDVQESDSSDDESGDRLLLKEAPNNVQTGSTEHLKEKLSKPSLNRVATRAGLPIKDFDQREKERYEKRKVSKKEGKMRRRALGPKRWSISWLRRGLADTVEHLVDDEDLAYALKMVVAIMLVTWPAFVDSWRPWYSSVRGVWAPLQLIMVFEVSIGTSFWVFFVRLGGVIIGCIWGFLAYEIGSGNPYILCVACMLGVIPGAFLQIGTKYVKAGMIGIISMCVVALVSYSRETPAWEIFVQRLVAFVIGGTFAILVEISLYPVRARDRLVECLSSCITQMSNMQAAIAVGVDDPQKLDLYSPFIYSRFREAKTKAQAALSAADTFLPFCLSEPRLKGSFASIAPVYKEIIYVLHQIIDRMDNMLALRRAYGSSVLEELNDEIYAHRRNVAASVTLTLFAANEALTTNMPLPQFLPSSRLAQLRLVNKVRHCLMEKSSSMQNVAPLVMTTVTTWKMELSDGQQLELSQDTVTSVTQQKFLAWNAAAAGQIEIIEYLEELVDLVKLLVGVNAFRSGMLERPSYIEYIRRLREKEMTVKKGEAAEKAKGRGEGMVGMAKAVEDVDTGAGKPPRSSMDRRRSIQRSSSFAVESLGNLSRRFTFSTPSTSAPSVPTLERAILNPRLSSAANSGVGKEQVPIKKYTTNPEPDINISRKRSGISSFAATASAIMAAKRLGTRQQRQNDVEAKSAEKTVRSDIEATGITAEDSVTLEAREGLRDLWHAGRQKQRISDRHGGLAERRPFWEDNHANSTGNTHLVPPGARVSTLKSLSRRSSERYSADGRFSNEIAEESGEHSKWSKDQVANSPEEIPISLQRMRTRMVNESVVERRRRQTLLERHRPTSLSVPLAVAGRARSSSTPRQGVLSSHQAGQSISDDSVSIRTGSNSVPISTEISATIIDPILPPTSGVRRTGSSSRHQQGTFGPAAHVISTMSLFSEAYPDPVVTQSMRNITDTGTDNSGVIISSRWPTVRAGLASSRRGESIAAATEGSRNDIETVPESMDNVAVSSLAMTTPELGGTESGNGSHDRNSPAPSFSGG